MKGASVPERARGAEGAQAPSDESEDAELASWALLDADPLAELRLLAREESAGSVAYVPTQDETPEIVVGFALRGVSDVPAVAEVAARQGLDREDLSAAARDVAKALPLILPDTRLDVSHVRQAAARAVVAGAIVKADSRWGAAGSSWDGAALDDMFVVIVEALGEPGEALGALASLFRPTWLPLWRSMEWLTSWGMRRRRGDLSESAALPLGDILRYQTRGEGLRACIAKAVAAAEPPVVVLAHSLGGVAAVDLFARQDHSEVVSALVTVGSQAPFLYELDALSSLRLSAGLPGFFPTRWLNVYDPRDPLAYIGAGVFGAERVVDIEFNTHRPLLRAHSAYWGHKPFYRWLVQEVLPR